MTREELFNRLLELFEKHIEARSAYEEWLYEKQVYQVLKESKDVDLEFDLKENQTYR